MHQAKRQPALIPAWHRERITNPSTPIKRTWPQRISRAAVNGAGTVCGAFFLLCLKVLPKHQVLAPLIGLVLRIGVRKQTMANMRLMLGNEGSTGTQWRKLWTDQKRHVGATVIESIQFGEWSHEQLLRQVTIEGEEHLRAALAGGKGVMLFISHLGSMGCIPAALGPRGYDLTITGNAMPIPYLERKVNQLYAHGGVKRVLVGEQLPFKAARTFHRNGIFAAFMDFTVVDKHNHWLPFGNGELKTNIGPALMALRHGAPILCASCHRLPGHQHRLTIHPPLSLPMTRDKVSDALAVTREAMKLLAEDVRQRPEQWWPWDYAQMRPQS
jgi:lauroyl/myristoyl acyltransferase